MKSWKRILVVLLATFLVACGATPKDEEPKQAESSSQFPITVIDQMDREVTFEEEPEKVVSTYFITTTIIMGLNAQDKLVGYESKSEKRPLYQQSAPEVFNLDTVGTLKEFNLEACIALEPDLVILNKKQKDYIEPLEKLGVKVLIINPESDELLIEMIELLGKTLNVENRANELLTFMDKTSKDLETKLKDVEKQTVYFGGNSELTSTAGSKMYQSTLLNSAGAINVADDIEDAYWANVSLEDIAMWNPEVIVLAPAAAYDVDSVKSEAGIQEVNAIKNERVYAMPNEIEAWDTPVPASVLGKVWIAKTLYPEAVSEEYFEEVMNSFYETFYGFTPSKNK